MWILPSQLSKCVQDTEGSVSVSDESLAKSCEQSLIAKSKPARANYYLREWKKGNLNRLRSGLILSHSLGKTSTDWYPSWLLDTLVSHSQVQEPEKAKMTLDTFFPTYLKVSSPCVPLSASSRMSKDISPLDSPASSAVWKKLVTSVRSAYALRQKWVRPTSVKESSSWPTIRASEYKDTGQVGSKSHTHMLGKRYLCAVVKQEMHSLHDQNNLNTGGNLPESWATPNTMDYLPQRSMEALFRQATTSRKGRSFPANLREQVNPIAIKIYQSAKNEWSTPSCLLGSMYPEKNALQRNSLSLATQAAWATPRAGCPGSRKEGTGGKVLEQEARQEGNTNNWPTPRTADAEGGPIKTEITEKGFRSIREKSNQFFGAKLRDAVETHEASKWATPNAGDGKAGMAIGRKQKSLGQDVSMEVGYHPDQKLNPRFVEVLMGLPIGWVMSTCAKPITIEYRS